MRDAIQTTVLLAVLALGVRNWLVLGLFSPVLVHGDSMAPTLRGPYQEIAMACPPGGPSSDPQSRRPIERAGDRLWIDRTAFLFRRPRRWEIVVFRCPERPTEFCVKRVVGLPGETVRIAGCEVFINGQTAGRSLPDPYLPARPPTGRHEGLRLGPDEYFVLGDNRTVSRDSRHWPRPGLDHKLLVGKPLWSD